MIPSAIPVRRAALAASLALLALLGAGAPAAADTIPVAAGDDLQAALDSAAEGDVVQVAKGTYTGTFTISTPGITLKGKGAPILDAEFAGHVLEIFASDVTVTGFQVVNGHSGIRARPGVEDGEAPRGLVITKNRIFTCQDEGIDIEDFDDCDLSQNAITACKSGGIDYRAATCDSTTTVSRNKVDRCRDDGIRLQGGKLVVTQNVVSGCEKHGIRVETNLPMVDGALPEASLIAKNRCEDNGRIGDDNDRGSGIDVSDPLGTGTVVEKNWCKRNSIHGLKLTGVGLVARGNRVDGNRNEGISARIYLSEITGNRAAGNEDEGIDVEVYVAETDGNGNGQNLIDGNQCKFNGGDGFEINGDGNVISNNKAVANLRDGFTIDGPSNSGIVVEGNTALKNGHQGITNNAQGTVITGNVAKSNGRGQGPDIAGAGEESGTVAEFADNVFGEGGAGTAARLDG